jgi:hypothetical protein
MLMSCYYFLSMIANVRPEKRTLANLSAPFSTFLPHFYTEAGNRYRRLHHLWLAIFLLLMAIAVTCRAVL